MSSGSKLEYVVWDLASATIISHVRSGALPMIAAALRRCVNPRRYSTSSFVLNYLKHVLASSPYLALNRSTLKIKSGVVSFLAGDIS